MDGPYGATHRNTEREELSDTVNKALAVLPPGDPRLPLQGALGIIVTIGPDALDVRDHWLNVEEMANLHDLNPTPMEVAIGIETLAQMISDLSRAVMIVTAKMVAAS